MTLEQPRIFLYVIKTLTNPNIYGCLVTLVKHKDFCGLIIETIDDRASFYVEARVKCDIEMEGDTSTFCVKTSALYNRLLSVPLNSVFYLCRKRYGPVVNGFSPNDKNNLPISFCVECNEKFKKINLKPMEHLYTMSMSSKVFRQIIVKAKQLGLRTTTLSILALKDDVFHSQYLFFRIENHNHTGYTISNTFSQITQERIQLNQELVQTKFSARHESYTFEQSISYQNDDVDIKLSLSPALPLIVYTLLEDGQSFIKFVLTEHSTEY